MQWFSNLWFRFRAHQTTEVWPGLPDWARFPTQTGTKVARLGQCCQIGLDWGCQIGTDFPPNLAVGLPDWGSVARLVGKSGPICGSGLMGGGRTRPSVARVARLGCKNLAQSGNPECGSVCIFVSDYTIRLHTRESRTLRSS